VRRRTVPTHAGRPPWRCRTLHTSRRCPSWRPPKRWHRLRPAPGPGRSRSKANERFHVHSSTAPRCTAVAIARAGSTAVECDNRPRVSLLSSGR
jgi:hypothetical protein